MYAWFILFLIAFSASRRYKWHKTVRNLKCTKWWLDICTHCERIPPTELTHQSPHILSPYLLWGVKVRRFKLYFCSKFWNWEVFYFQLHSSFSRLFSLMDPLDFRINFKISWFISARLINFALLFTICQGYPHSSTPWTNID